MYGVTRRSLCERGLAVLMVLVTACKKDPHPPGAHPTTPQDAAKPMPGDAQARPSLAGAWISREKTGVHALVFTFTPAADAKNAQKYLLDDTASCDDAGICEYRREYGTYVQSGQSLTLTPQTGAPRVLDFALQGDSLVFKGTLSTTLTRVATYCRMGEDCSFDPMVSGALACPGGNWTCNEDNMCNPKCSGNSAPAGDGAVVAPVTVPATAPTTDAAGSDDDDATTPSPTAAGPDGGVPCGNVVCPAGKVCCNPLSSICTNPGEACMQ